MWSVPHHARTQFSLVLGAFALIGATLAIGCSGDRMLQPMSDGDVVLTTPEFTAASLGHPVPVDFSTYEKSNQVVHPSAVTFPSDWHGRRVWLALTPYPNSDSHVENPSLYGSESGDEFSVPTGVTNPIATTSHGYLSDPDLAYDPSADELRMYYREVVESRRGREKPKHRADIVYLTRSKDGLNWSPAKAVVTDMGRFVVSPAVARQSDADWKMWAVDAGHKGCAARHTQIVLRRSMDGVAWSAPTPVAFTQPGYLPWHLDVQYVPAFNAYWALVAAYPQGLSCTASSLFLATSIDGMHWTTYASPAVPRGAMAQFSANVYRSTFAFEPDGDALTIWLTGATTVKRANHRKPPELRWSAAVWHTHREALLEHVRTVRKSSSPVDSEPSFLRRLATENALP
jgi:hypothetical protein